MKKSVLALIKENLSGTANMVSRTRKGTYLFRKGFFYTHGVTSTLFAQRCHDLLTTLGLKARLVDDYQQWRDFRGGAPIQQSSHWGAEFEIEA